MLCTTIYYAIPQPDIVNDHELDNSDDKLRPHLYPHLMQDLP
jgi:hypothetical protein